MAQTEALMLVGLGFVLALILVFAFGRGVWSVSNRFAKRQRENDIPAEMMSLRADRDKLRAEHSVMRQRLEAINDSAKAKMATQTAEVSRHRNRVIGLTEDVNGKESELNSKMTEVENLTSQINELSQNIDEQQKISRDLATEIAEKAAKIKQLESENDSLRTELVEVQDRADRISANLDTATQENDGLKQEMAQAIALKAKPNAIKAADRDLITGFNFKDTDNSETLDQPNNPFDSVEEHKTKTVPVASAQGASTRNSRFNFDRPGSLKIERNLPSPVKPNDISKVVKEARRSLSDFSTKESKASPMAEGNGTSEGIISLAKRLRAMQAKSDEKIAKTLK